MDNYVILCLKKRRKSNDKVIGTTQYLIILCVTVKNTATFYKGGWDLTSPTSLGAGFQRSLVLTNPYPKVGIS